MSSSEPEWWTKELLRECLAAASRAWPNETSGMISAKRVPEVADLKLNLFAGLATPREVTARPDDVVEYAYWLTRTRRFVLATFHTHPLGQTELSERDQMLFWWAAHHVVAVRDPVFGWRVLHSRSTHCRQESTPVSTL